MYLPLDVRSSIPACVSIYVGVPVDVTIYMIAFL